MNKQQWKALIYGWFILLVILLTASFILAILLKYTSFDEPALSWVAFAIGIIALFIGGLVAGMKGQLKGWAIGLGVGVGFTLFTLLSQYVSYNVFFSIEQILYHLLYILAAIVGGIVGVNRLTKA